MLREGKRGWGAALMLLASVTVCARVAWAAGPIGINVAVPEFVDVVKGCGGFSPPKDVTKLETDEAGWPKADCRLMLFDSRVHMPWNDNGKDPKVVARDESGVYAVSFTGQATIETEEPGMFTVQNMKFDEPSNVTTAELVVPKGVNFVMARFSGTHGGIRNLRVIRPGYPADTKQLFTDRFLKGLAPFDTLRLMDFAAMNSHSHPKDGGAYPKMEPWADRRLPTAACQAGRSKNTFGVAWEYATALANETKKNVWICVPVAATDEYIEKLAELLKKDLGSHTVLYLEYSNEVWNWGFCQSWWNKARAEKRAAAAAQPGGDSKDAGLNYVKTYAERTAEIGVIFRKVFGENATASRIRPVLCWQMGGADAMRAMCAYIEQRFGTPKEFVYGLAVAPYLESKDTSSVDACIQGMIASADNAAEVVLRTAVVAKSYGLHMLSYEGGPGLSGEKDLDVKIAANRDLRIVDVIKHFLLEDWYPAGGELFMQYSYVSQFGRYGNWGILEPTYDLSSPKYQAYLEVLKAPQPPLSKPPMAPAEIGGQVTIDEGQALGTKGKPKGTVRFNPSNGQPRLDYAFGVKAAGTYEMAIGGDAKEPGDLEVRVDETPQTVTLPAKLTFDLAPGLHGIDVATKGRKSFGGAEIVITRTK